MAEDTPQYKSPKRALALAFRLSRDRWKAKAQQRRDELRKLRSQLRDLQASRDLWKAKAQFLQALLDEKATPAEEIPSADAALPTPPVQSSASPQNTTHDTAAPASATATVGDAGKKKRHRNR